MSDKRIEIQIAATGGDQAAAEIRKVETAARSAEQTVKTSTGFGGMLDGVPERAEVAKKSLEELRGAAQKAKSEFAGMADESERIDDGGGIGRKKELAIATGAVGIAAGLAAKTLKEVYDQLGAIDTASLRNIDSAFADQIENAKKFREALEDPIGALVALANGGTTMKEAFADMNEQLALSAEQRSAEIDRILAKGEEQVDEIKKLADELRAANALFDAKDQTEAAKRDGQDAAAIRNGADPDDVRAQRAKDDAAVERARIDRELNASNPGLQESFEKARAARLAQEELKNRPTNRVAAAEEELARLKQQFEVNKVEGRKLGVFDFSGQKEFEANQASNLAAQGRARATIAQGATPEERAAQAKAAENVKKAEADFAERQAKRQRDEAVAAEQKKAVTARAENTVADATGDKAARLERERNQRQAEEQRKQEQERRQSEAAEIRRCREAAQEERERARGGLDRESGRASGVFGRGADVLAEKGKSGLSDQFRSISKSLENGTDSKELAALSDKFQAATAGMTSSTIEKLEKMLTAMEAHAKRMDVLDARFKNLGGGTGRFR
jgi:hypothetical protein